MNCAELTLVAEQAIARQTDTYRPHYRLVIYGGVLKCKIDKRSEPGEKYICSLTGHQLRHGLSASEWLTIGDRLQEVVKELKL